MDICNHFKKKIERPRLEPDWKGEYSYLRFVSKPLVDWTEVHLPNDESYLVGYSELRIFLKNSKIRDYEALIDCIHNFGCVLWNRYRQTYFPVHHDELLSKEEVKSFRNFI